MKVFVKSLVVVALLAFTASSVVAQLPSDQEIRNFKVDNLSDDQLQELSKKAQTSGLTTTQLLEALKAKGMPAEELAKLQARLQTANVPTQKSTSGITENTTIRKQNTVTNETYNYEFTRQELKVFGAKVFSSPSMSFEPNMRVSTPKNYVLGTADELVVQVYGQSEAVYRLTVSPEGNVSIPNVGPINILGLSIDAATQKIRNKLQASIYSALASGATKLQVTLGNIRSIKVIVTGQAKKPGIYTVSSLATAFNLLYLCGGPSFEGSYREVQVIRGRRLLQRIDLYKFLIGGDVSANILLAENDVLHIPYFKKRITLEGQVKQPGFYEATDKENLATLINYAGGLSDSAFSKHVSITRNTGTENQLRIVAKEVWNSSPLFGGERILVDKVNEEIKNRVTITGAVKKPGVYDVTSNQTLLQLVNAANGLEEFAFTTRVGITRTKADLSTEYLAVNIADLLSGSRPDVLLQAKDEVFVPNVSDLNEKPTITIEGEVKAPKQIAYSTGITLKDAILLANGFTNQASSKKIEIGRRFTKPDSASSVEYRIAEVINVSTNNNFGSYDSSAVLQPFDIIYVRSNPNAGYTTSVSVQGEVKYPGRYIITQKGEKLAQIIERAGGITVFGDVSGASLLRRNNNRLDTILKANVIKQLAKTKDTVIQVGKTDEEFSLVAANIEKAIDDTLSTENIAVQDGDMLIVPQKNQIVRVRGEVLQPAQLTFLPNRRMLDYISRAGGFSPQAFKRKAFLVSANGNAKTIKKFFVFKSYPKVAPGDEIIVPQMPDRSNKKLSTGEIVGVTTAVTSLATIVLALIRL